jgi:hypothetical protein
MFNVSVRRFRRSWWPSRDRFESRNQVTTLQLTVVGCPAEGKSLASEEEDWLAGGTKKGEYFSEVRRVGKYGLDDGARMKPRMAAFVDQSARRCLQ